MTPFMLEYTSSDVASLFDLREKLLARVATLKPDIAAKIERDNAAAPAAYTCKAYHEVVPVPPKKRWCVIGRGGAGIESIERRTGGFVSCSYGAGFLILGATPQELQAVRNAITAVVRMAKY